MVLIHNAKYGFTCLIISVSLNACAVKTFPNAICERIYVEANNTPVIGVEDMAYDSQNNRLFLSAYDRRSYSDGGIYTLKLDEQSGANSVEVIPILEKIKPHGIDLVISGADMTLALIDKQGEKKDTRPVIRLFQSQPNSVGTYNEVFTISDSQSCASNDLVLTSNESLYISQDHKSCTARAQSRENIFSPNKASVIFADKSERLSTFTNGLSFANGLVLSADNQELYVAETRKKHIAIYDTETGQINDVIKLSAGPDNLTQTNGEIYAALIPSLLQFARFQKNSEKRVKSRFSIVKSDRTIATYDIAADIISGATVAIKTDEYIWLGAAYDTAIARCKLPQSAA